MKAKHELIALFAMIAICLLFAACAQKAEDKLTDKATDPALISSTTMAEEKTDGEKDEEDKEVSEDKVDEKEAEKDSGDSSVSPDTALEELKYFYGSLYTVEETGSKNSEHYYTVTDKNGKEYAKVTVDTDTANVTETLSDGTVNEWNMLV